MAEHVLKDCKILFGEFNLSGDHNTMSFRLDAELLDNTTFGASFRSRMAGLRNASLVGGGFFDAGVAAPSTGTKTGTGSATMQIQGTVVADVDKEFKIEIDGIGGGQEITQATFRWSHDGGTTWEATTVATSAAWITLSFGVQVKWTAGAGDDFDLADYWTFTAEKTGVDTVLEGHLGVADEILTVCPTDGTDGEIAYTQRGIAGEYEVGAAVGEILPFTFNASGSRLTVRSTIMSQGDKEATANGTARQLGAVVTGQSVYAAMHVLGVSGTAPTLDAVIASDDAVGFPSTAPQITFAQQNSRVALWGTPAAGPITDDWWRVELTIGGASPIFNVLIAVGIV